MCESVFATIECELLNRRKCRTKAEARLAIFEFIERCYDPGRRHPAPGYLSPIDDERSTLGTPEAHRPKSSKKPGKLQLHWTADRVFGSHAWDGLPFCGLTLGDAWLGRATASLTAEAWTLRPKQTHTL